MLLFTLKPQKAIETFTEALRVLGDGDNLLKSDICMGLADAYALCKNRDEAFQYIKIAQDCFPMYPELSSSFLYASCDLSILHQWEGKMYLDLSVHYSGDGYQQKAWDAFDVCNKIRSTSSYSNNETIIYQADTARALGDLSTYSNLLSQGIQTALSLGSKKRYNEAIEVYQRTPAKWRQEA